MKRKFLSISLGLAMLFALTAGAAAEEKKAGLTTVEDIKSALGMSVYVQGGFNYNFENPDSGINQLRVFDQKANSFTLDLAQLVFTKDAPAGGVGYKLKLSAGETAKYIHAAGLGDSGKDAFDLTEAYITYLAKVGNGLKLQFGKFVTMHGAEVIEAKDNMNYSRGLLFNFAIPFTHTGLMVSYPFSEKVSTSFYVVNGWDNFDDEGNSKTLGLSVSVAPVEQFSFVENLMNGREMLGAVESNRFLSDTVITVKPLKNLTFVANTDYAIQHQAAPDGKDAKWYGMASYVKYDFSDLFSTTVRAEYFNDPDGVRMIAGTPQHAKEATLTPEFRVAKDLIVRPEYRHDWSDKDVFDSSHKLMNKKSQDTIALGVMYTW